MVTQQGGGPMTTTTVQPAKLPKFGGGKGKSLEMFLALMKLRFSEYGAKTPEEKMRLVLGGLRGEAATWFAMYIETWADERFIKKVSNDKIGEWISFKEFITYLKQCHGLHDDLKEKARHEWLGIQQGTASVLQYNQEFDRLLAVTGTEYPTDESRVITYK